MSEAEELRRMSPKERMKRLKEIEIERKKEIEKAQRLITETEHVLEEEELRREMPTDLLKAESLSDVFSPETKEIFKAKRYISGGKKEKEAEESETIEEPKEITLEEVIEEARVPEAEGGGTKYKNIAEELMGAPAGYKAISMETLEQKYKSMDEETFVEKYKHGESTLPEGYRSASEELSGSYQREDFEETLGIKERDPLKKYKR